MLQTEPLRISTKVSKANEVTNLQRLAVRVRDTDAQVNKTKINMQRIRRADAYLQSITVASSMRVRLVCGKTIEGTPIYGTGYLQNMVLLPAFVKPN
jgi:hypothetical protein